MSRFLFSLAVAAVVSGSMAKAATYSYFGAYFDTFSYYINPIYEEAGYDPVGGYSTNNRLTASFTFAGSLGRNSFHSFDCDPRALTCADERVSGMSFSNGKFDYFGRNRGIVTSVRYSLWTDASGRISNWDIRADPEYVDYFAARSTAVGDTAHFRYEFDPEIDGTVYAASEGGRASTASAGVWSIETVPLPATWPLFAAGLLGLNTMRTLRRRKQGRAG